MTEYTFINGEIVESKDAKLSIKDLAFLRGYGIFDFIRTVNGRIPFLIEKYLDRFYNSAGYMNLSVPYPKELLQEKIRKLLKLNPHEEAGIRLVLTGGYSKDSFEPSKPNLLIIIEPIPLPAPNQYKNGACLISHQHHREWSKVKSINYITPIMLIDEMKKAGAIDVLYYSEGLIYETSRTNFFIIKNNTLITPNEGILHGITRSTVIDLAKDFCKIEKRELRIEELESAEEAFITGTTKKVLPIVQIDNKTIGNGKPGPITKSLLGLFLNFEKAYRG